MGRTVVVTGSASGIGAATANALRQAGDGVIGVDLRDADVVADLGTPAGRDTAIAAITDHGGSLDGLVACAGVGGFGDRPGSTVVSVNYFGTVALLEGLRSRLAEAPGRALAIASNSSTIQPEIPLQVVEACLEDDEPRARGLADEAGAPAAYAVSKLALARWIRRHAPTDDWAGAGIRLNAIAPGRIDTPLIEEGLADPELGPLIEALPIPTGPGRPEQVATLLAALLGPAGDLFCGAVLCCDGGTEALLRPDDWPAAWSL